MIHGWNIAMKLFSKWRPYAILNFRSLLIWSLDLCLNMIVLTKFRLNRTINDKSWRYSQKTTFNMAAVRHIRFVVTSSYSIWEHYLTFLTLCQIFKYIGLVVSDITWTFMFHHFGLKLLFWGQNLTFWSINRGQVLKLDILSLTPKRHIFVWFRAFWAIMRQNRSKGLISARASEKNK